MHRPRTEGRRGGMGEVSWAEGGWRMDRGMEGREGEVSLQGRPHRVLISYTSFSSLLGRHAYIRVYTPGLVKYDSVPYNSSI